MSKSKGRLPPFVPLDQEMMNSSAWRATSYGARWLYVHLKRRWSFKQRNNGHIFLSQRDAQEEMGGHAHRDSISRWFRELQHYGLIVMTNAGGLGVDGKGKAPHWRLTEAEWPGGRNGNTWMLPTKDYLKWNGTKFQDDRGAVLRTRKNRIPARTVGPGWPVHAGHSTRQLARTLGPYSITPLARTVGPYLVKPLGWGVLLKVSRSVSEGTGPFPVPLVPFDFLTGPFWVRRITECPNSERRAPHRVGTISDQ